MADGGPLAGLASALSWGAGDFAGGVAARRMHVFHVVLVAQLVGFALILALALLAREPAAPPRDLLLGAAAGASGAVGVTCLYASLASGRMGIAAPITGVIAAIIPVSYAWLVAGAPSAFGLAGTALAILGITLVSAPKAERPPPRVLGLALLSGLGFAGFLLLMGLTSGAAFLWPLTAARVGSTLGILALVLASRPAWTRPTWSAAWAGALDAGGNAFFLLATRLGRLDVAVILSSLYPVATVVLARLVLKEQLTRMQAWGAALMLGAIPLVAMA